MTHSPRRASARASTAVQLAGDRISLCLRSEFDSAGGCRWQSDQRYREVVLASDGACAAASTAESIIQLR
jgi:hypothetical protein